MQINFYGQLAADISHKKSTGTIFLYMKSSKYAHYPATYAKTDENSNFREWQGHKTHITAFKRDFTHIGFWIQEFSALHSENTLLGQPLRLC